MIALACDHAGLSLKESIKAHLDEQKIPYEDFGTYTNDSVDYPVFAQTACKAVKSGKCEYALLFCGTGIGMSMAANKMHGIRAAVCADSFSVRATRQHNNANVLCLGERVIGPGLAADLVDIFLNTPFEGGRHERRVELLESENTLC